MVSRSQLCSKEYKELLVFMMKMAMLVTFLFCFSVFSLVWEVGHCSTVLVDGVSEWKNPTVHVGDTVGK